MRPWPWQRWPRPWPLRRLPPDHRLGRLGEALAARALRRRGYRILVRNLRRRAGQALPHGEIDLVVRDSAGQLVFVEVKTRARHDPRFPAERAVDWRKRRNLERFARQFCRRRRYTGPVRFDVVVIYEPDSPRPEIRLHQDAFSTCLNSAKTPSPAVG